MPKCPKCKSANVVKILYGYPLPSTFEEAEKGLVELGGCCIGPNMPKYSCKDCSNRWGTARFG